MLVLDPESGDMHAIVRTSWKSRNVSIIVDHSSFLSCTVLPSLHPCLLPRATLPWVCFLLSSLIRLPTSFQHNIHEQQPRRKSLVHAFSQDVRLRLRLTYNMSTIDPGMEDGIKQSSHNLNGTEEEETSDRDMNANVPNYDAEEERAEEEKEDFMKPSSWWFASTACPLLAGTFGPIASGFNVCALVYEWRTYIPVDGTEEHGDPIPDPAWLVVSRATCSFDNGARG